MPQCVAVCCGVLRCVAVCCGVLRCTAVCGRACCSVLQHCIESFVSIAMRQCVAVCCSVLQCVAVCGSVLQHCSESYFDSDAAVCCSLLQSVAVCCNLLRSFAQCSPSPTNLPTLDKKRVFLFNSLQTSLQRTCESKRECFV